MEVSSDEDLAGEFCCVGSIFSMTLLGFVRSWSVSAGIYCP